MRQIHKIKINGKEYNLAVQPTPEMLELMEAMEACKDEVATMENNVSAKATSVDIAHSEMSNMCEVVNDAVDTTYECMTNASNSEQSVRSIHNRMQEELSDLDGLTSTVIGYVGQAQQAQIWAEYYSNEAKYYFENVSGAYTNAGEMIAQADQMAHDVLMKGYEVQTNCTLAKNYMEEAERAKDQAQTARDEAVNASDSWLSNVNQAAMSARNALQSETNARDYCITAEEYAIRAENASLAKLDETLDAILAIQASLIGGSAE